MSTPVRLTEMVTSGGCAAKIGPGDLSRILAGLSLKTNPNLLVGIETGDDAAVYRLNDTTTIIHTLDFFTPIVDDPYLFGQIAAANALSDIYAMGGHPLMALNIFAFPCSLGEEILQAVLKGGADKVEEAGAVIAGGHSLEDKEPKYGLAVCGIVDPSELISNANANPGDILVLTKPLGLGILTTALRDKAISETDIAEPLAESAKLNKAAAQSMSVAGVSAATDVTGFGLAGHLIQMLKASSCSATIVADSIPFWPRAISLVEEHQPGGTSRNSEHFGDDVVLDSTRARELKPIIFDPQTSGGLLMAVPEENLDKLLAGLEDRGVSTQAVIGRVEAENSDHRLFVA